MHVYFLKPHILRGDMSMSMSSFNVGGQIDITVEPGETETDI